MSHRVTSSEFFRAAPEAAYDALVAAPLEELFCTRAGPIPPIKETTGHTGPWGAVGDSRRAVLADGTSNLETLVGADRETRDYRYRLTEFTGPFKALVDHVDGSFTFTPEGDGTRVTWSWLLHPTNPVAGLALPVVAIFWRKYAAAMWPRFGARL